MVTHQLAGLRPIRRARRLSLAQASAVIGVKPNSYSRFEAGDRRIYFDKAAALAKRLGVRVDDLTHPLDEAAAIMLCDQRDREAIANGTFDRSLWSPGAPSSNVPPPPPPALVPPPPEQLDIVVNGGTLDTSDDVAAQLQDWNL